MGRREIREHIFKLLFRIEFNDESEMAEQKEFFTDEESNVAEKDMTEIIAKYDAIMEKLPEIDSMIGEKTTGWNTKRMGKVDLTILRLAVYEICFDEHVPASVAINEAVELAKKYGQDESYGFVNGVLAKFTK